MGGKECWAVHMLTAIKVVGPCCWDVDRPRVYLQFYNMASGDLLSSRLLSKNLKIKIYRNINLPVVLYGCETRSLTLREERELRVFENMVLRRIFGPRRDEVTENGGDCITRSLMISTPHPILCG